MGFCFIQKKSLPSNPEISGWKKALSILLKKCYTTPWANIASATFTNPDEDFDDMADGWDEYYFNALIDFFEEEAE
jgi:hypothetical protein